MRAVFSFGKKLLVEKCWQFPSHHQKLEKAYNGF